jgi:hypothetical protein
MIYTATCIGLLGGESSSAADPWSASTLARKSAFWMKPALGLVIYGNRPIADM